MRFKTLAIIFMLLLQMLSAQAQSNDFPTLDALEDLRLPGFDYADMVGRLSPMNPEHIPPESPPVYSIGGRETMRIAFRKGGEAILRWNCAGNHNAS